MSAFSIFASFDRVPFSSSFMKDEPGVAATHALPDPRHPDSVQQAAPARRHRHRLSRPRSGPRSRSRSRPRPPRGTRPPPRAPPPPQAPRQTPEAAAARQQRGRGEIVGFSNFEFRHITIRQI